VRFLVDECLSVDLVTVAGDSGHEARHVAHVGRAGWKDWNVVRYASDGDFILVTNNASDFRQLYAAQSRRNEPIQQSGAVVQRLCSGEQSLVRRFERFLDPDAELRAASRAKIPIAKLEHVSFRFDRPRRWA
jgi:hypothetical protein